MKDVKKMKTVLLFLVGVLILTSCSSLPKGSDVKVKLAKKINTESLNRIKLVDFKTTSSKRKIILGHEVYQISFDYTIDFQDTCWKQGSLYGVSFSNFKVYLKNPQRLRYITYIKFNKGDTVHLSGSIFYEKSDDDGWIDAGFNL